MESKITKTRKYRLDMNEKILNSGCKDLQKFFALIIGGSIVIPHLRYAFEILDELLDEQGGSGKT